MKAIAIALAGVLYCSVAAAQDAAATAPTSRNEAAGLPNLEQINSDAGRAHATVDYHSPRTPSFFTRGVNGTTVTEYRDRGRPTEINVHSNFGTNYQMTAPADASPQVPTNVPGTGRLPSIRIGY